MKIGILQCGHLDEGLKSNHGDFEEMFSTLLSGHGFEFQNYVVVDSELPKSVEECDGWLVTGSVHAAYEDHPWIAPLEEFIRQAYGRDIPIAGICFGHQVMAQALGGKVEKYSGGWGLGTNHYKLGDKNVELLASHQDQVVEIPAQAQVIASSDFCANAGLAYGRKALSFQPHPEFTPQFMRDLVAYKETLGFSPDAAKEALDNINDDNDSAVIAMQIAEFYKAALAQKSAREAAE